MVSPPSKLPARGKPIAASGARTTSADIWRYLPISEKAPIRKAMV
jgi:hypothetical protein